MDSVTHQEGRTRRGFVRRVTQASAAAFASLAALEAEQAAAYPYHCCGLARDNRCSGCGNGSQFSCPSGYRRKYWVCCERGGLYGCGECTKGATCRNPPWACSCGFALSGPCR